MIVCTSLKLRRRNRRLFRLVPTRSEFDKFLVHVFLDRFCCKLSECETMVPNTHTSRLRG